MTAYSTTPIGEIWADYSWSGQGAHASYSLPGNFNLLEINHLNAAMSHYSYAFLWQILRTIPTVELIYKMLLWLIFRADKHLRRRGLRGCVLVVADAVFLIFVWLFHRSTRTTCLPLLLMCDCSVIKRHRRHVFAIILLTVHSVTALLFIPA